MKSESGDYILYIDDRRIEAKDFSLSTNKTRIPIYSIGSSKPLDFHVTSSETGTIVTSEDLTLETFGVLRFMEFGLRPDEVFDYCVANFLITGVVEKELGLYEYSFLGRGLTRVRRVS